MKASTQLRICSYALALLGFWSVTLTDYFPVVWAILAPLVVAASWFYEGPRKRRTAYGRVWLGLAVCALVLIPVDVMWFSNLLLPAVHLSMFSQAYVLFNPKNPKAYRRIFLLSFAQLLASTNLTTELSFAIIFAAYCLLAFYGIALLHLLRESQDRHDAGQPTTNEAPVTRGLLAASLLWVVVAFPSTMGLFYTAPRMPYALVTGGRRLEALTQTQLARSRTGFSKTVHLGTFGPIQEDETLALRVEVPGGPDAVGENPKWRGGALNIYDGVSWSSSRDDFIYYNGARLAVADRNSGRIGPRGDGIFILDERLRPYTTAERFDADPRLTKQIVYLEIPFSDSLFAAGEVKAFQGPFDFAITQDFNDSFYIRNRQRLPGFLGYTAYSMIREPDPSTLRQVSFDDFRELLTDERSGAYVRTHYLQAPGDLNPGIRLLATDISQDAATPYDQVHAIQTFLLTEFEYSLDRGEGVTDDPLSDFLFTNRVGHCEYFATAMTVMTRLIGIPARLARGFQTGEWNEAGGFYEVRQRDAHAWVEVYFPGDGWVSFDPSPRAAANAYFDSRRSSFMRMLSDKLLMLRVQWRRHVIGYNQTRRESFLAGAKDLLIHRVPGAVTSRIGKLADAIVSSIPAFVLAGAILAATILAYLKRSLLLGALRSGAFIKRRRSGVAFYEHMLRALAKRHIVKPPHVTALEFLDSPPLREHPLSGDIRAITSAYYRVRFGGETLAHSETAAIRDALGRLKRRVQPAHDRESTVEN
jgi:transglutaminase-like putative cysteine protease